MTALWFGCSPQEKLIINRIHEGSIQIVSGGNASNFENLLEKTKEITIRQGNLQVLIIEFFKIKDGYAPSIMDNFFIFRENTQFKKFPNYIKWKHKSSKIWLGDNKTWKCDTCACRLCRPFLQNLDFIWIFF